MSSNQDPIAPTMGGTPRPSGSARRHGPMTWIYATSVVLGWAGISIVTWVDHLPPTATSTPPLFTVGVFLEALSMFVFFTVPGTLLVMHHPWGDADNLAAERRFAHPRLLGQAQVWAGLVLSGSSCTAAFAPAPFSSLSIEYWLNWSIAWVLAIIVVCLVALAPLLALVLFDRRR